MNRFEYFRPSTVEEAIKALAGVPDARALAGGTNLVDLMKYNVTSPSRIVDINRLPLNGIEETDNGGLKIGVLVSNSDLAWNRRIEERFPLLSSAIRRCLTTTPKRCDDGRKLAAADPLLLLL